MANQQHLDILKQDVYGWNKWRREYPDIRPDLSGANLALADLSGTDLRKARPFMADFGEATLCRVDFRKVTLGCYQSTVMVTWMSYSTLSKSTLSIPLSRKQWN